VGRVFTSQLIAEQLVEFAKERPCAGIRIKAARDGEGNGVQVQIELTGGSPTGRVQDSWRTNQSVWLGSKPLTSSGGGVSFEHLTSSDGLKDLKKHLDTAISQPDEAMRVSVLLEK